MVGNQKAKLRPAGVDQMDVPIGIKYELKAKKSNKKCFAVFDLFGDKNRELRLGGNHQSSSPASVESCRLTASGILSQWMSRSAPSSE